MKLIFLAARVVNAILIFHVKLYHRENLIVLNPLSSPISWQDILQEASRSTKDTGEPFIRESRYMKKPAHLICNRASHLPKHKLLSPGGAYYETQSVCFDYY